MEKDHTESNTNKRNGDNIMSNVEKPLRMSELANIFHMNRKTLKKHLDELKVKFPDEPCLHREINGRPVFYLSDFERLKECQVQVKTIN